MAMANFSRTPDSKKMAIIQLPVKVLLSRTMQGTADRSANDVGGLPDVRIPARMSVLQSGGARQGWVPALK
jgi:hypothetical protein